MEKHVLGSAEDVGEAESLGLIEPFHPRRLEGDRQVDVRLEIHDGFAAHDRGRRLDPPNLDGLDALWVFWTVTSIPAASATDDWPKFRSTLACSNMSGPPVSATTNPKPLPGSNHFTVPVTVTRSSSESKFTVLSSPGLWPTFLPILSICPSRRKEYRTGRPNFRRRAPLSGRQPLHPPGRPRPLALPAEPVVQPERPVRPELDFRRNEPEPAPVRRPGRVRSVPHTRPRDVGHQRLARRQRSRLAR